MWRRTYRRNGVAAGVMYIYNKQYRFTSSSNGVAVARIGNGVYSVSVA